MVLSVNVYKDSRENIIIIPFAQNSNGISCNLNKPQLFERPYNIEIIGSKLKESFDACEQKYSDDELAIAVHEKATGKKGWKNFFKDRTCINIIFDSINGNFSFGGTTRNLKYKCYDDFHLVFEFPLNASNEQLGEALLKTFDFCK